MTKKIVALIAATAFIAPSVASASTGGFVSLAQGKKDISKLAERVRVAQHGESKWVHDCHHDQGRADKVICKVRIRFVDTDRAVGYTHFTGVATTKLISLKDPR